MNHKNINMQDTNIKFVLEKGLTLNSMILGKEQNFPYRWSSQLLPCAKNNVVFHRTCKKVSFKSKHRSTLITMWPTCLPSQRTKARPIPKNRADTTGSCSNQTGLQLKNISFTIKLILGFTSTVTVFQSWNSITGQFWGMKCYNYYIWEWKKTNKKQTVWLIAYIWYVYS